MQIGIVRDQDGNTFTLIFDTAKETIRVPGIDRDLLEVLDNKILSALKIK